MLHSFLNAVKVIPERFSLGDFVNGLFNHSQACFCPFVDHSSLFTLILIKIQMMFFSFHASAQFFPVKVVPEKYFAKLVFDLFFFNLTAFKMQTFSWVLLIFKLIFFNSMLMSCSPRELSFLPALFWFFKKFIYFLNPILASCRDQGGLRGPPKCLFACRNDIHFAEFHVSENSNPAMFWEIGLWNSGHFAPWHPSKSLHFFALNSR